MITTSPVLCVSFAAKLRMLFGLVSKLAWERREGRCPDIQGEGRGEAGDTVAVTVLIPRFSGMDDRLRARVTTGSTAVSPDCDADQGPSPSPASVIQRYATVYPRACGGTLTICQWMPSRAGLSPRLRGNLWDSYVSAISPRSIPAPAGEPSPTRSPTAQDNGLSPRLRGNHMGDECCDLCAGSIPAPAGEPTRRWRPRCLTPVYPRACGGTRLQGRPEPCLCGLSPRLRGTLSR